MLKYWTVLSFLTLYNSYLELFVSWLPFYSEVKCGLLLWLLVPQSGAVDVAFARLVVPSISLLHHHLTATVLPAVCNTVSRGMRRVAPGLVQWLAPEMSMREEGHWRIALGTQMRALAAAHEQQNNAAGAGAGAGAGRGRADDVDDGYEVVPDPTAVAGEM